MRCLKRGDPDMARKTPAQVVIAELGVRPLARQLDVSPSTVCKWLHRGIPSKWHASLLRLGKGSLTADDLVRGRK